jgi:hypothetical protein
MTTKIKWRLSKLPTPSELVELVNNKLVTQEEAKEILFTQEDEKTVETSELKSEIEFLRHLVEELAQKKTATTTPVTIIHECRKKYSDYTWYQPYYNWTSSGTGGITCNGTSLTNLATTTAGYSHTGENGSLTTTQNFSDIKTF